MARIGRDLTAQRKKAIPKFAKAVTKQLNDLGFAQSQFDVALTSASDGDDAIEFQFAPNPGEPPRPLRAVASSGELFARDARAQNGPGFRRSNPGARV